MFKPKLRSVLFFFATIFIFWGLNISYSSAQKSVVYSPGEGITDVAGIKVGHHTLKQRPTGCTAILIEKGAVAGVDIRGFAPGTRETALLDPVNVVQEVHGISLAGGSAFGLDAASGVVRYLEERESGFPVGELRIPIVPAAILFDLQVGDRPEIRPDSNCGYQAALAATSEKVLEGNVGAGAGATVGKLLGNERAMKSGVGTYSVTLTNGITVGAIVVVNAVGSAINPQTGNVVAGIRTQDGKELLNAKEILQQLGSSTVDFGQNTTIGVVATNASLNQAQVTQIARMAHSGLARSIVPAHTPFDGDTLFSVATGELDSDDVTEIGSIAAEVTSQAIFRAVTAAKGIPSYPGVDDL
ncbi:P1 family peptidase [Pleurocapsa sp. PCC 7319]|uniref:P1 family peptidase n=1 Tax=Pleurocapsa sp. PCC 7319 TaxID=118161 RepID=UPI00034A3D15|nr:P1 family peptidase [Pleurocapsa sp. PCC 7319]